LSYTFGVADLAALDELCAWMRSHGATSARMGDVSLTLGQPIAPPMSLEPLAPLESPEEIEWRDLETLLMSSGADVTPFLRKCGAE
jgi:hypothetical protein